MRNSFNTPTGLYFYVPGLPEGEFGQQRAFIIEGTITGRVVDLGRFQDWQYAEERLTQLKEKFPDYPSIDLLVNAALTNEEEIIEKHFKWIKILASVGPQRLAAIWWALIRDIANAKVNRWSKLLVSLGVDIVVDPGYGIIHHLEPAQIWARPGIKRQFTMQENKRFQRGHIGGLVCEVRQTYVALLLSFDAYRQSPGDVYGGFDKRIQPKWRQVGFLPLEEGEWIVSLLNSSSLFSNSSKISIELYKNDTKWEWRKKKIKTTDDLDDRDPFEDNSWW
jgi:hypothetical protein